ncbi:hydroxymethylglutaryl-CoA synthase [Nocardia mexicana]|uniref:Hydroxymethylglutaryl-CoA synthase n=1 Tax=Nocardia mexicana TaxID=279262 RepID=A0A370H1T9_9NOCA|nr:hydroxymethylglutaryl-CoA synthase [Nocardia mexicana]RDI49980.1 hydroxymethylglutaryl-CoA synthase [Nocardia mexicana]
MTETYGIHDLSFATSHYVLTHQVLADETGVEVGKYHRGIGQDAMSIAAPDEDIVTMAAAAARPIIDRHGPDDIRTVLLATETSIDQSKSAGVYVSSLLGLPAATRAVELKQACYSGTAALQFALALVHLDPSQRVLVITTDIAKYELGSAGEATQGAAAVAMLVGADPALLRIERPSGLYTADIMDFWRPNYRTAALVDGQASITAYLQAVEGAWKDYTERGGRDVREFTAFCYHQPFTKMAHKGHRHLATCTGLEGSDEELRAAVVPTTHYNRVVGNSYTASMYLGLASLLDHSADLTDAPIAFFSYGSGCVAEFFGGTVVPGYRNHLRTSAHTATLQRRRPIDFARYRELHDRELPRDGGDHEIPRETAAPYRLAGLSHHRRIYESN